MDCIGSECERTVAACRSVPFVAQTGIVLTHENGQQTGTVSLGVGEADLRQELHGPGALAAPRPFEARGRVRDTPRTDPGRIRGDRTAIGHKLHHANRIRGAHQNQRRRQRVSEIKIDLLSCR